MKTIAVLGASADRRKFGNICVRAYRDEGFEVFPVNPKEREIEGLPAYSQLAQVPQPLDLISIYLPPAATLALLPAIADCAATTVWFNPGAADRAVLAEASRLGIRAKSGCSIVDIGRSPSDYAA